MVNALQSTITFGRPAAVPTGLGRNGVGAAPPGMEVASRSQDTALTAPTFPMVATTTPLAAALLALASATSASAQCQNIWLDGHGCPGVAGQVMAMQHWDPDGDGPQNEQLVIAGWFLVAGDVAREGLALWDPSTGDWSALPPTPMPIVSALAVSTSGHLVVGGYLTGSAGFRGRVAEWDGAAWTVLGADFDEPVSALHVRPNGDLLAAGAFNTTGGTAIGGLVRWTGTAWQTHVGFVSGQVSDLCELPNGELAVSGWFSVAGVTGNQAVARWNGAAWLANGAGLSTQVMTIAALPNGALFAGNALGFWRWNGATWTPVAGLLATPYPNATVTEACALSNGTLAVGGRFASAGGQMTNGVALFDPVNNSWATLGAGVGSGTVLGGQMDALAELPNGDLIVGGIYSKAGPLDAIGIARHDGSNWFAMFDAAPIARTGAALDDDAFVVAGRFDTVGNLPVNSVALWNGASWQPLGNGLAGMTVFEQVDDLLVLANGDLLAGGTFDLIGGVSTGGLARWDGSNWTPIAGGGVVQYASNSSGVRKLVQLANGDVVVGGWFAGAGAVTTDNIAIWNGAWSALGAGLPDIVADIKVLPNGNLLALTSSSVAEWDGSVWLPRAAYAASSHDTAQSLALTPDGGFLVAGSTSLFFGTHRRAWVDYWPASGGFVWRTETEIVPWFPTLKMQELPDGEVLVSGSFREFGGVPVAGMVRMSNPPLSFSVSEFANTSVFDFTTFPNGDVLAVGSVTGVGGTASYGVARLTTTCPATVVVGGSGCIGSGGSNVLTATSLPWIGSTFVSRATGMPGNGLALAVRGLATASVALPTILPQGQTGCSLLVTPDLLDLHVPVAGEVTTSFAIPDTATLIGQVLHQQVVPLDLNAVGTLTAVTATNRLTLTIGRF